MPNRTRRLLIWLTYLGFACRVLIPAGYMPAPFAEGGPIILCHGGLTGKVFEGFAHQHDHRLDVHDGSDSDAHHGGIDESDGQHAAWELCPVGSALSAFAVTADFELHVLSLSQPISPSESPALIASVVTKSYWARAPPQTHSSLA